jgi:hypothetical protein
MDKFCIVSVVVGAKYKKFAEVFIESYERKTGNEERADVILVVDNIHGLNLPQKPWLIVEELPAECLDDIDVNKTYGTGTVRKFDYSLKRYGYQAAIDRDYKDICFIDMDMTVRHWDLNVFTRCDKPGLWAGRGYPTSGFGTKPVKLKEDLKFTPKLASLKKELNYDTDWLNYTMPFEAVMYMKGIDKPVMQKFIDCWKYVSDATKRLRLPMNKVTHEIGLAADMCGIDVHYNVELLSKVFKHYIMNHQKLLNIHQINKDKK